MSAARRIVCLMTGSPESSAAALLVKNQGYNISGAFINNKFLSAEENKEQIDSVRQICDKLKVPFHDIKLSKEAWNPMEEAILNDFHNSSTPDIDVLYNQHILFGSAYHHVTEKMQAVGMTTGHYVKSSLPALDWNRHPLHSIQLLRPYDTRKDDTLRVSQIPQKCLEKTMFPLGVVPSETLSIILNSAGLSPKEKNYNLAEKISHHILQKIPKRAGSFVDLETKKFISVFENFHEYCVGQTVDVDGVKYVVSAKDKDNDTIHLVSGADHPSLVSETFFVSLVHWIWQVPYDFYEKHVMSAEFCTSAGTQPISCNLTVGAHNEWCGNDHVIVSTGGNPTGPIVPGQYCAIYKGELCMGSGKILYAGPSEYAMNYAKYAPPKPTGSSWSTILDKNKGIF